MAKVVPVETIPADSEKDVDISSDNIKVAVRVRPFNKREKKLGAKLVVQMEGQNTYLLHPERGRKKFSFDYCYWSFDSDGSPNGRAFQTHLFADLGKMYVKAAMEGYNSSIFAYGQSGSGKSYSIFGIPGRPGLVPMGCEEIFQQLQGKVTEGESDGKPFSFVIQISFLEIYNEEVRDLLIGGKPPQGGLRVRTHPKTGPYVEGLSKRVVASYDDVKRVLAIGEANRFTSATGLNNTSSRSHAIVTLYLAQKKSLGKMEGKDLGSSVLQSQINLIDLAGSERQKKTGATGARFKEAVNINKSLLNLGSCLKALSDQQKERNAWTKKYPGRNLKYFKSRIHVPFRNSKLTQLLKESLSGDSKTIMVAAISPADDNVDETLSTLNYAARAASIRTSAKKHEKSQAAIIAELKETIATLRDQLQAALKGGGGGEGVDKEKLESINRELEAKQQDLLVANADLTTLMQKEKDWQAARIQALSDGGLDFSEVSKLVKVPENAPRLITLHLGTGAESNNVLFYVVAKDRVVVGANPGVEGKAAENESFIVLPKGITSMKDQHALLELKTADEGKQDAKTLYITALHDPVGITVNGVTPEPNTAVAMPHGSRLTLAGQYMFQIFHPSSSAEPLDLSQINTTSDDVITEIFGQPSTPAGGVRVPKQVRQDYLNELYQASLMVDHANDLAEMLGVNVRYGVVTVPCWSEKYQCPDSMLYVSTNLVSEKVKFSEPKSHADVLTFSQLSNMQRCSVGLLDKDTLEDTVIPMLESKAARVRSLVKQEAKSTVDTSESQVDISAMICDVPNEYFGFLRLNLPERSAEPNAAVRYVSRLEQTSGSALFTQEPIVVPVMGPGGKKELGTARVSLAMVSQRVSTVDQSDSTAVVADAEGKVATDLQEYVSITRATVLLHSIELDSPGKVKQLHYIAAAGADGAASLMPTGQSGEVAKGKYRFAVPDIWTAEAETATEGSGETGDSKSSDGGLVLSPLLEELASGGRPEGPGVLTYEWKNAGLTKAYKWLASGPEAACVIGLWTQFDVQKLSSASHETVETMYLNRTRDFMELKQAYEVLFQQNSELQDEQMDLLIECENNVDFRRRLHASCCVAPCSRWGQSRLCCHGPCGCCDGCHSAFSCCDGCISNDCCLAAPLSGWGDVRQGGCLCGCCAYGNCVSLCDCCCVVNGSKSKQGASCSIM